MAAGDYVDVDILKNELEIDDTVDDEQLEKMAERGNRYVDDLLFTKAATLPLTGDQKSSADNVALAHAKLQWYKKQKDYESVKEERISRNEEADVLIKKLEAQPSTNTQSKVVVYSQNYRTTPATTNND